MTSKILLRCSMEVLFCPCIRPPVMYHQCVKRATLSENGGTGREVWPKTLLYFQRTVCQHTGSPVRATVQVISAESSLTDASGTS